MSKDKLVLDPDFDKKLRDHLSSKERLFGEASPFSELLQNMVNTMLEGEMSSHLALEKVKGNKNKRNGSISKKVLTEAGNIAVNTPRDRYSSFKP